MPNGLLDAGYQGFIFNCKFYTRSCCTHEFRAPELIRSNKCQFHPVNDVFSLGMVIKFLVRKSCDEVKEIKENISRVVGQETYPLFDDENHCSTFDAEFGKLCKSILTIDMKKRPKASQLYKPQSVKGDEISHFYFQQTNVPRWSDARNREVLIKWMKIVCDTLELKEGFVLATILLEKYLSILESKPTSEEYKYIGTACMYISECINYTGNTEMREWIMMSDNTSLKEKINQTITRVLTALEFKVYDYTYDRLIQDTIQSGEVMSKQLFGDKFNHQAALHVALTSSGITCPLQNNKNSLLCVYLQYLQEKTQLEQINTKSHSPITKTIKQKLENFEAAKSDKVYIDDAQKKSVLCKMTTELFDYLLQEDVFQYKEYHKRFLSTMWSKLLEQGPVVVLYDGSKKKWFKNTKKKFRRGFRKYLPDFDFGDCQ